METQFISTFRIKQLIQKRKFQGVASLKLMGSLNYVRIIKELSLLPYYKGIIADNPFPKEINRLGRSVFYAASDSIVEELCWHASILSAFHSELSFFLNRKRDFDRSLLLGKYDDAIVTLNKIEEEFGQSLWLIESKLNLLELSDGTEMQKDYLQTITRSNNVSFYVKILSNFFSIKNEKNYPSDMYRKNLRDLFSNGSDLVKNFIHDVSFRFDLYGENRKYNYCEMMSRMGSYSMIDRLLLYIRVCQYLLSFDSKTENLEAVKQSINIMNNSFENYLITNIINSSGSNPSFKYNDKELCKVMKIIDLYTKGKYEEVKTEYQDIYQEMPERLEITLPFVKSITSLGENIIEYQNSTLLFNISEHLFNIITKNEQAQESYMGIQKLIDIYISCEWASQLQWILHTEYYPNQYDATAKKFIRFGLLNSISYNPYNILYWNTEIKELIFSYLEREHNDSVTYKFLYNISEKNDASIKVMDIPIHRKNRFLAQIFLQSGLVDRAYDLILSYADSENIIVKQHYITDYLNFLIKTNDYDKAIELVVDIYFSNSNLFVCMPIEEFLMKVEVEKPASIQSNICLPILYEIYSRNIKKDKDFYISESYEDYLILNGYERPSELGLTVGIDVKKIIYFLDNVCVPHIMDSSVAFNSTDDIDKERIAICQILKEIDPLNVAKYSEEIKNITHRLTIKQGIIEIEESKIYVDIEGIKKSIQNSLREKYSKFLIMLNKDQEFEFYDVFIDEYKNLEGFEQNEMTMIRLSRGSMRALLSIILEVRNHFVSSNEYGLDGYLSNGIRHGTIQGQLRSPLEKLNLITQKDSENNVYRINEYWKKKLKNCDSHSIETILHLLSEFSRGIDERIDYLKNTLIQIKLENKNPNAIFDYQVYTAEFESMYWEIVTKNLSFEEFLELIFSYLWRKTDDNLKEIRNTINGQIKEEINNKFDELMKNLEQLKFKREYIDENALGDLVNAIIEAKTAIQYELNNVENWFRRSKTSTYSEYDISLPIEIATKVINNIYPNQIFAPATKFSAPGILKGKTLKSFVDIYFTLFDNIIKHCSTTNFSPSVEVEVIINDFIVEINIVNQLPEHTDHNILSEKIKEINDSVVTYKSHERASKEGGTGFYKINKIISVDLDSRRKISVSASDNKFRVQLIIDAWGLLYENTDY